MALHKVVGSVVASALIGAGAVAATPPAAAQSAAQAVRVIALTTADGEPTEIADGGLEALRSPQPARGSASAATTAADGAATDDDGAPAGVAVLTAPVATEEFFVAGVTWEGEEAMPAGATVFIRVMENGQWHEWAELEVESSSDEPSATGGTEPYIAGGAEAVQVQITADQLPPDVRLTLTPEWPSDEEVVVDDAPLAPVLPPGDLAVAERPAILPYQTGEPAAAPAATAPVGAAATPAVAAPASSAPLSTTSSAASRPAIVSRAGWGANESQMRWRPTYANLRAAVVHHTAGTNNYTQAQSPSIVRGIYHYHSVSRGWGDIGYNFLIDKWGRIYEGRSGTLASAAGRMPIGAHAAPFNTGTVGLSVMGDYTRVPVPQVAMNAMADIIAWQFGRAGLEATDRSGMTSPGTAARPKGQNLGRVFAHRDVSATACPGNDIYSRMGWLAQAADDRNHGVGSTPVTPVNPAPAVPSGTVYLNNSWGPLADITYPFGDKNTDVYVGDWDGDGKDTLALRRGNTFAVYNSNSPDAEAWVIDYGRPGDEVLVGDWDGDGRDSLGVRRGNTFFVKNRILPGAADEVIDYGRVGDEVLVGDWNRDGTDTFAVRRGATFYVKNSIDGGVADKVVVYGRPDDTVLVGDWDGNGTDTLAVRRERTYYIKNVIADGPADRVLDYGRPGDSVLVGDWDGNGTDTLGVHRY